MRYRCGMTVRGPTTPLAGCLNCGQLLDGGPQGPARFCPACGQETNVLPPTLREFAQQFGGAYFSTEGALWRTLRLLLFRPGELTRQYLAGRRKHYVLPLRLYLTISVLVLLLARMLGSTGPVRVNVDLDNPKSRAELRNFTILGLGEEGQGIGMQDGVFYCNSVPQWVCKRVQRRIGSDPKALAGAFDDLKDRFVGNLGGAMFILLPSYALGLKLAYRNRRLRYTEHLVFALHVHAFWFLALLLVFTNVWWLSAIGFTLMPVYTFRAMRRVYGGRRWPRLLRGAVVALLYGIVLAVALLVVAVWSMLA
jgi:hypothetical protein